MFEDESVDQEAEESEQTRSCVRCNHRTPRRIRFIAKVFYYPGLWRMIDLAVGVNFERPLPAINVHVCADCQRIRELPVIDLTNGGVLDWLPIAQVIPPNTEVVYI